MGAPFVMASRPLELSNDPTREPKGPLLTGSALIVFVPSPPSLAAEVELELELLDVTVGNTF